MRISDWSSDVCSSDLIIARVLRGALIGHDHRLNANVIEKMVLGSTAIVMPSPQVGATAPLLTAIELQVEHLRTVNRMSRTATLEAVFPMWTHGVIRSDLSRRLGVDMLSVTNAQINARSEEHTSELQSLMRTT